jgi:hypothetical protein
MSPFQSPFDHVSRYIVGLGGVLSEIMALEEAEARFRIGPSPDVARCPTTLVRADPTS